MKLLLTPISLLLIIAIYTTLLSASAQQPAVVLDTDQNPVRVGANYYILPVSHGLGGGLTLSNTANQTCPLSVFQEPLDVQTGLPLTFRPVNATIRGVIRESTDLNIIFSSAVSICIQSNVWRLNYDESIEQYIISGDGVRGNPGQETINNWFKIEMVENNDYKLVFCPSVCDTCRPICSDIGVRRRDGRFRLVRGGDFAFRVAFIRA